MAQWRQGKIIGWICKLTSSQETSEHNGPGAKPGVGSAIKSEDPPPPNSKENDKAKNALEWAKTIIAGLALIVAGLAYSAARQSADFAGQSAIAAGKTADAAQRNVATAQAALQATIENNRLDQRAWVGVVEASIVPRQIEAGPPIKVGATIKNNGKTPALKLKAAVGARMLAENEKFIPIYTSIPPERRTSRGILFPGVFMDVGAEPRVLNQEQVDALKSGLYILYVFGNLEYEDIFGGTHCTTFCLRFAADFSGAAVCETHNSVTDAKCRENNEQ